MSTPTSISASSLLHLAPQSNPTCSPSEIRALVLEYLCSSCHLETAKAFARECDEGTSSSTIAGPSGSSSGDEGGVGKGGHTRMGSGGSMMVGVETGEGEVYKARFDPDGEDEVMEGQELGVGKSGGTNGRSAAFRDEEEGEEERDWGMLSAATLRETSQRRDIRDHILAGRIQDAINLLNTHFPMTLNATSTHSKARSPNSLASFYAFTSTSSTPNSSKSFAPVLGSTFSPSASSLTPEILSLNLQLQTFVELIRGATVSSTSRPSTPSSDSALDADTAMSASISSIASSRTSNIMKAISYSQTLGSKVRAMREGKEKEAWEKECVDVSALLAYSDLSICPVRGYLAQERREGLAEMVNAAILYSTGHAAMPVLALAARQTTALWSSLADFKVSFPPGPLSSTKEPKSKPRTVPRFSLREFLSERGEDARDVV